MWKTIMKIREYLGLYNIENVKCMECGLGDKESKVLQLYIRKKVKT